MKSFRKGDRVTWSSHGGAATGRSSRKITRTPPPAAALYGPARTSRSTWCAAATAAKPYTVPTRYVAPVPSALHHH